MSKTIILINAYQFSCNTDFSMKENINLLQK